MEKIIIVENKIDPIFPEEFDDNTTERLVFKNCIFNEDTAFGYEGIYFIRLQFESCIFNGKTTFSGTDFRSGFILNHCIFTSKKYTSISSVSSNEDSIEITNNIFHAFFNFRDNFPDAPIIIKNNIFLGDTNLLDGSYLSLELRDIDCVENNLGQLDVPLPQHYYPKKGGT